MAKSALKTSTKSLEKKTAVKTPVAPDANPIVKASETALQKLKDLGIGNQLQADLEWCIGSYKADKNPAGLYEMVRKSIQVFKDNKTTKGVTSKLISDLEKVAQ